MKDRSPYILGITAFAHEASCALLRGGELRWLIEEERLNRERHTDQFPRLAIRKCLELENITFDDIEAVTFFMQPLRQVFGNVGTFVRLLPGSLALLGKSPTSVNQSSFFDQLRKMLGVGRALKAEFGLRRAPKVHFVEHHLGHASSAFFVSPFERAAILTLDGRGESSTTMMAVGEGTRIEKLHEIKVPHSLGHLYAALTSYLGFKPFFDEWKVMGMSAYGGPGLVKEFDDVVAPLPDGGFELNLKYFRFHVEGQRRWLDSSFFDKFGPPRAPTAPILQRHYDMAYALQRKIESIGVHLANHLHKITGSPNLCLAGGVALNGLMNREIILRTPFQKVFVQPIANDAGVSAGSALYHAHHVLGLSRNSVMEHAYLGPEYSDLEIEAALKEAGLPYRSAGDICAETADLIAQGKVIAWFQGRMEAGPRALGNRSILADPTDPSMKDRLNALVKKREAFRPFAPSVLEERASEYFELPKGHLSPFMVLVSMVRPQMRGILPAVTHVDGSARVQTVSRAHNDKYWRLIAEFGKLTGVPVILNTSFNENEPIVCTPAQAIACFRRADIDVLCMGSFIAPRELRLVGPSPDVRPDSDFPVLETDAIGDYPADEPVRLAQW